jgi:Family of unknown function (DUF5719)
MKITRPLALATSLILVLLIANAADVAVSESKFSSNFPAVVCPSTPSGLTTAISLPSSKSQIRLTGTKSLSFIPSQTLRYIQSKEPIITESQGTTPVVWQIRKGVWAGATICSSLQTEQWFVGGAADVTSKGRLILVNSGLSAAIVDVEVWNEIGPQTTKAITIKANSYLEVGVDSLAPGSQSLVIKTVTRAGRITSYMIDERGRGLRALGGDVINFTPKASREVFIPAIPHTVRKVGNKSTELPHSLRLLVPGEIDARVTVSVFSTDGSFIPAGLEDKVVKSGSVVNLDLNPSLPASKFGVRISSDEPIVASVFSPTISEGKSDFIWSTAAAELNQSSFSVAGLAPQLIFIGKKVRLELELTFNSGKGKSISVKGEDIATIKIPDGVRSISITKSGKGIYGAGLIATKSGYGYFPLTAGSVLTKSSVPMSNIRVLTP